MKNSNEEKLISIIVPIFRVQKYLNKCVDSILNQSYSNIEVILVDDGSDDNCPQICDQYKKCDDRVVVIHKQNGGLSSARNAGLNIARGEYVGFIDSDDYIDENMFKILYRNMILAQADISICGFFQWGRDATPKPRNDNKFVVYTRDEILERFFRTDQKKDYFAVWCRLYSKRIIENLRFKEGVINEDVEFSYHAFLNCSKVCETQSELYGYNIGNVSITRMPLTKKDLDLFQIWKSIIAYAEQDDYKNLSAALFNYNRSSLTLLIKYAMFGIEGFQNPDEIINEMKMTVRHSIGSLLMSKGLDGKRKIAAILCAIDPRLVKLLFEFKLIKRRY